MCVKTGETTIRRTGTVIAVVGPACVGVSREERISCRGMPVVSECVCVVACSDGSFVRRHIMGGHLMGGHFTGELYF